MAYVLITALLFLGLHTFASLATDTSQPRLRLSYKELWDLNRTSVFQSQLRTLDLRTMYLDEYQERLFVGGRDHVYSLSLENISEKSKEIHWLSSEQQIDDCYRKGREQRECANFIRILHHYNRTHILACGTGAFDPVCTFIRVGLRSQELVFQQELQKVERGRGRCPFDPDSSVISTLAGGELFVGLYNDFWGRDATLFRSMGHLPYIRTEHDDDRILKEPKFVDSFLIPDNEDKDDNKIYFFYTEKAIEGDGIHALYSRVGRVCANDVGGQRMMVNKWTTFLKARLTCSVPGRNGIDTHFDELEDVFLMHNRDAKNPEIFALFSTTSNIFKGYAVCVYQMASIREAFNGPYAHKEGPEYHWTMYEGKVPYPRPGSCPSKVNGGHYGTTKDYPDEALRFARSHPLMYEPIKPIHKRPILVKVDGKYNLKQIAVDRVQADDGQYDVMFLGTDNGIVLKSITIYNQETETMEEVILEELQVFQIQEPIVAMEISAKRQQLYIGSKSSVAQLKLHQCEIYGTACADCCLARDPYCAWDGMSCTRYFPIGIHSKRRFRRQDVRHGNAAQQCSGQHFNGEGVRKTEEYTVYGVEHNSTLLECMPRSLQSKVIWFVQKAQEGKKDEVKTCERVIMTEFGLLFLKIHKSDAGIYYCQTVENSYVHIIRKITLEIVEEERVDDMFHKEEEEEVMLQKMPCPGQPSIPQSSRQWYKEFLQLIGYSNFQKVEEYCEKVWCPDKRKRKLKMSPNKWKHVNPQERKSRGRSDHHRMPRHLLQP
ncbi:semaphorin-3E isoform X1 [Bufo gargarizans]|uniref:semaphorin-3E isoform X1 n=1 Tax=Bufo gargarizans TaxID=30331 RepID=UPI001CF5A169|nr:semaphorin-3E isoform X1 [Bufo gargarizans]